MEIQNKEAYDQIFFNEDARKIFPMARYMMQLEDLKDLAVSFLDNVKNTDYPFIYTDYARPNLAINSSEVLVNAIAAEELEAESRFRDELLKILRETRNIQKRQFGYVFDDDPVIVCRIIRNLKDRFYGDPVEDSDEEILEKIIFTIDLNRWSSDFFEEDIGLKKSKDRGLETKTKVVL